MSDMRGKQLAGLLREIENLHKEKSEYMTGWKDRLVRLENAAAAVGDQILTGQMTITEVGEKVAAQVNDGLLDKDGVKCTMEVVNR
jgi:hypothetical protein